MTVHNANKNDNAHHFYRKPVQGRWTTLRVRLRDFDTGSRLDLNDVITEFNIGVAPPKRDITTLNFTAETAKSADRIGISFCFLRVLRVLCGKKWHCGVKISLENAPKASNLMEEPFLGSMGFVICRHIGPQPLGLELVAERHVAPVQEGVSEHADILL